MNLGRSSVKASNQKRKNKTKFYVGKSVRRRQVTNKRNRDERKRSLYHRTCLIERAEEKETNKEAVIIIRRKSHIGGMYLKEMPREITPYRNSHHPALIQMSISSGKKDHKRIFQGNNGKGARGENGQKLTRTHNR